MEKSHELELVIDRLLQTTLLEECGRQEFFKNMYMFGRSLNINMIENKINRIGRM